MFLNKDIAISYIKNGLVIAFHQPIFSLGCFLSNDLLH
ncbi:hypothetical protein AsAng_0027070 [Aureispira anguillae]|uniref:Uncharacterized protein n=1 Tax=Aureispira anguillae TaxID=2864201 RepID=A0A915YFB3_9BACT|nr:hypothetical protein AsAng_0027070 [Aureispira anguillae]